MVRRRLPRGPLGALRGPGCFGPGGAAGGAGSGGRGQARTAAPLVPAPGFVHHLDRHAFGQAGAVFLDDLVVRLQAGADLGADAVVEADVDGDAVGLAVADDVGGPFVVLLGRAETGRRDGEPVFGL